MTINISTCIELFVLAFLAALLSVVATHARSPEVSADTNKWHIPFLYVEGFYRSFLINLSFAGMSVSISAKKALTSPDFWNFEVPSLWVVVNLFFGMLVALFMIDENIKPLTKFRSRISLAFVVFGLAAFVLTLYECR